MTELTAAYQRNDELTKALRKLRGELEVMASYGDPADETSFVACINLIDDALASTVM